MSVSKEQRAEVMKRFRKAEKDTGSTAVQIALLTARIKDLTNHLRSHRKDNHSRYGMLMMVNKRNRLLKYLFRENAEEYKSVVQTLGIRAKLAKAH